MRLLRSTFLILHSALALCALCALALCANAQDAQKTQNAQHALAVPSIFGDNMVLQRDRAVPVWGTAAPGETITVTFAGQSHTATTGPGGRWRVNLNPLSANKNPGELVITGQTAALRFTNVLVGEVWLCSGQSNMEWQLRRTDNAEKAIAAANHPLIRLYQISKRDWSERPLKNADASWKPCSPESAADFSGVAYYFGRELAAELNVPIGLINSSWGGTRIEPWTSPVGFAGNPALKDIHQRIESVRPGSELNKQLTNKALADHGKWLERARKDAAAGKLISTPPEFPGALRPLGDTPPSHQQPTVVYNSRIAPIVPYAFRGLIWYQGEANRADGKLYTEKMRALMKSWRAEFEYPNMPVFFAQLAPFIYKGDAPHVLPELWQAQQRFATEDPHAGMVVINDVGNINDIHPTDKLTVGKRLSLLALNKIYGRTHLACESPVPSGVRFEKGAAIITFANAKTLVTRDGAPPSHFELAGIDGAFMPATAAISGNTVTVRSPAVPEPLAVRFAWDHAAEPNLRNEAGLQAGAFTLGDISPRALLDKNVPEAAAFKIACVLDPFTTTGDEVTYTLDNTAALAAAPGKIKRLAYYLQLIAPSGAVTYAFASMDPFTTDLSKIGVPTKKTGARFQQYVKNLEVKSNVPGVKTGRFEQGNIEFWDCNYSAKNDAKIPGASDTTHDIGDAMVTSVSPGYGSMQIHNTAARQTILAYNNWRKGKECDIGIGNQPVKNPDWTFSASGKTHRSARLIVLVEFE